ncbi:expressed unknown protein [Seminavis robusta]|uniref:LysM domain-containing protein n=1 Tax=Seminavis robusta TaxID=568900 RepID=A0A9N8H5H5_9STRA|nr:expressed unknown protein [Seminavis robusta]|eukprot:Sro24_g016270.1 n/a (257) ;mRNA; f:18753-19523
MADGGTFPWKRQNIDESRGPAGSYDAVYRTLPDLPDGVAWQRNEKTREWSLIRVDQQQEKDKYQYKLQRATAWNPRTGREQLTVTPVPKVPTKGVDDDHTVATVISANEDDAPPLPVVGKDYIVHTVVPSDTFSGLCLRYKIKPVELRRINYFSGTNLALAPSKLLIPLTTSIENLRLQDTSSPEYKMQMVLTEFPKLASVERKAYLEMNEWDLEQALEEIRQDTEWEKEQSCTGVPVAKECPPGKPMLQPLEVDA